MYSTQLRSTPVDSLTAWTQINEEMAFGPINREALSTDIVDAQNVEGDISLLEAQLVARRNLRDDIYSAAWDKIKRVRAGVKANYGDDSSEFELIGGTRRSERKSPSRKVAA